MYDHKHYIACKLAHSRAENAEATKCPQCDQFFGKGALLRHLKQKGNEECWRKWADFVMEKDGIAESGGRLRIKKGGQGVKGKGKEKADEKAEEQEKEKVEGMLKKKEEVSNEKEVRLKEKEEMPRVKEEMSKDKVETLKVAAMKIAPTKKKNVASSAKGGEKRSWAFNSGEVYRTGLLPPQLRKSREEDSEAMRKDEEG